MIPHEYLTNFLASLEPQNDTVFRSTADMDTFIDQQMTLRCELYRKLEVEPPRLNSSIQQGIFFFFFFFFFFLIFLFLNFFFFFFFFIFNK